ncbi:MAG TPA: hypothetical protein VI685_00940 [Candidatus Angelobacter sp.]
MRNRVARIIARVIKFALMGIVALTLFGFGVMLLWNWLMPTIFGLRLITFWQALGLVILSKIFFGSFHSHQGGRARWRRGMQERWEKMTPEEREKFRAGMRSCGGPPTTAPTA